ncbi:uncharacterized protein MONOS_11692 [Monocercomonoides exilis]|uniref:uncharacterized protein n=1 Tax=Monocercomonoides exilis TaxID=2049356 RepID=UPI00355A4723|nr:hypothetical protein MONOS_11692 [Monocercomonoides exilis]|eukprot:MONOS_11692.1-p1 / transcript=MONOS_11692.1 / gene=MONOS_11692 / organism=Monocercomonoides_exilis_PA203 / gene_product=unspecified product / transcript_product=unspecified product / location=Mono_scaffold00602:14525-18418(+) / protein_length=1298 / sequence_SO=supercontig / SO=protein_coding / is_pseudo=false
MDTSNDTILIESIDSIPSSIFDPEEEINESDESRWEDVINAFSKNKEKTSSNQDVVIPQAFSTTMSLMLSQTESSNSTIQTIEQETQIQNSPSTPELTREMDSTSSLPISERQLEVSTDIVAPDQTISTYISLDQFPSAESTEWTDSAEISGIIAKSTPLKKSLRKNSHRKNRKRSPKREKSETLSKQNKTDRANWEYTDENVEQFNEKATRLLDKLLQLHFDDEVDETDDSNKIEETHESEEKTTQKELHSSVNNQKNHQKQNSSDNFVDVVDSISDESLKKEQSNELSSPRYDKSVNETGKEMRKLQNAEERKGVTEKRSRKVRFADSIIAGDTNIDFKQRNTNTNDFRQSSIKSSGDQMLVNESFLNETESSLEIQEIPSASKLPHNDEASEGVLASAHGSSDLIETEQSNQKEVTSKTSPLLSSLQHQILKTPFIPRNSPYRERKSRRRQQSISPRPRDKSVKKRQSEERDEAHQQQKQKKPRSESAELTARLKAKQKKEKPKNGTHSPSSSRSPSPSSSRSPSPHIHSLLESKTTSSKSLSHSHVKSSHLTKTSPISESASSNASPLITPSASTSSSAATSSTSASPPIIPPQQTPRHLKHNSSSTSISHPSSTSFQLEQHEQQNRPNPTKVSSKQNTRTKSKISVHSTKESNLASPTDTTMPSSAILSAPVDNKASLSYENSTSSGSSAFQRTKPHAYHQQFHSQLPGNPLLQRMPMNSGPFNVIPPSSIQTPRRSQSPSLSNKKQGFQPATRSSTPRRSSTPPSSTQPQAATFKPSQFFPSISADRRNQLKLWMKDVIGVSLPSLAELEQLGPLDDPFSNGIIINQIVGECVWMEGFLKKRKEGASGRSGKDPTKNESRGLQEAATRSGSAYILDLSNEMSPRLTSFASPRTLRSTLLHNSPSLTLSPRSPSSASRRPTSSPSKIMSPFRLRSYSSANASSPAVLSEAQWDMFNSTKPHNIFRSVRRPKVLEECRQNLAAPLAWLTGRGAWKSSSCFSDLRALTESVVSGTQQTIWGIVSLVESEWRKMVAPRTEKQRMLNESQRISRERVQSQMFEQIEDREYDQCRKDTLRKEAKVIRPQSANRQAMRKAMTVKRSQRPIVVHPPQLMIPEEKKGNLTTTNETPESMHLAQSCASSFSNEITPREVSDAKLLHNPRITPEKSELSVPPSFSSDGPSSRNTSLHTDESSSFQIPSQFISPITSASHSCSNSLQSSSQRTPFISPSLAVQPSSSPFCGIDVTPKLFSAGTPQTLSSQNYTPRGRGLISMALDTREENLRQRISMCLQTTS